MYKFDDLFGKQSVVGARLEDVLEKKGYTKVKFCQMAGISRPTLDKLLSGTITSSTNYEKHMKKVLDCLDMTPDMLMGNIHTSGAGNQVRSLRNQMRIKERELAEYIDVSVERIREIETGEKASLAELRDIAVVLNTSVRSIMEKNYFPLQNEFWGYAGIRPESSDTFWWYPISSDTRDIVWKMIENEYLVLPCMNNKILLANTGKISEIVLLDDDCDKPLSGDYNNIFYRNIYPLVIYEALDDYLMFKEEGEIPPKELISSKLEKCLKLFEDEFGGNNDFYQDELKIYYPNGKIESREIFFYGHENISDYIFNTYLFGEDAFEKHYLYFEASNGAEIFINLTAFSMLEVPLLRIEEALDETFDEELHNRD